MAEGFRVPKCGLCGSTCGNAPLGKEYICVTCAIGLMQKYKNALVDIVYPCEGSKKACCIAAEALGKEHCHTSGEQDEKEAGK